MVNKSSLILIVLIYVSAAVDCRHRHKHKHKHEAIAYQNPINYKQKAIPYHNPEQGMMLRRSFDMPNIKSASELMQDQWFLNSANILFNNKDFKQFSFSRLTYSVYTNYPEQLKSITDLTDSTIIVLGQRMDRDVDKKQLIVPDVLLKRAESASLLFHTVFRTTKQALPLILTGGDPAGIGLAESEIMKGL